MQKRILAGSLCTLALAILADSSIQDFTFTGWVQAGEPEFFKKDSLFGYIDGGAEIFLQSGFVDLSVSRYRLSEKTKPEKVITLEVYRMESPADTFGIFSIKREGNEKTSPRVKAVHWISPTQASLVKGSFYINISGQDCTENDIEVFAAAVSEKIKASAELPPLNSLCLLLRGEFREQRGISGESSPQ